MSRHVGPGRPPKGSRFRKGESGNPKGRPRKPKQRASVFEILFDRRIPLTQQNGQQRDLTVEEALQLRTYQDAVAGKRSAIRDVLEWIMEVVCEARSDAAHREADRTRPGQRQ